MKMRPSLTSSRPAIMRSVVDLPQPDSPSSTTNSPWNLEVQFLHHAHRAEGLAHALELQADLLWLHRDVSFALSVAGQRAGVWRMAGPGRRGTGLDNRYRNDGKGRSVSLVKTSSKPRS
jgi:hypothetical protein